MTIYGTEWMKRENLFTEIILAGLHYRRRSLENEKGIYGVYNSTWNINNLFCGIDGCIGNSSLVLAGVDRLHNVELKIK